MNFNWKRELFALFTILVILPLLPIAFLSLWIYEVSRDIEWGQWSQEQIEVREYRE